LQVRGGVCIVFVNETDDLAVPKANMDRDILAEDSIASVLECSGAAKFPVFIVLFEANRVVIGSGDDFPQALFAEDPMSALLLHFRLSPRLLFVRKLSCSFCGAPFLLGDGGAGLVFGGERLALFLSGNALFFVGAPALFGSGLDRAPSLLARASHLFRGFGGEALSLFGPAALGFCRNPSPFGSVPLFFFFAYC